MAARARRSESVPGVVAVALMLTTGCGGPRYAAAPAMTIVDAHGGEVAFEDAAQRFASADVAFVGEMHGHPAGLDLARRLFTRVGELAPHAALSLELVERDQQADLDAYLAGTIDEAGLAARRGATLPPAHLAMIDDARARHLPVRAANAPRRFAKQARIEGWDALRALSAEEQTWFVIPTVPPSEAYRARFAQVMGMSDHAEGAHGGAGKLEGFYRAQTLWDATMADAVVDLLATGRAPVVHVVGKFHVAHDGGLAQLVRRARPDARIVTLVVGEDAAETEAGAGDLVAWVGKAPASHP